MKSREQLESMKVAELKEESRSLGLTLESKGHKFNKQELIERILQAQDVQSDINKAIEEAGQEMPVVDGEEQEWDAPLLEEKKLEEPEKEEKETKDKNKTENKKQENKELLAKIEEKYTGRKSKRIYDNDLVVGSFVVYIRYIETKTGMYLKKLGTAKVIGVNRKKELVRVQSPVGAEFVLSFDALLFIRGLKREQRYPSDIYELLRRQREEVKEYRERVTQKYGRLQSN